MLPLAHRYIGTSLDAAASLIYKKHQNTARPALLYNSGGNRRSVQSEEQRQPNTPIHCAPMTNTLKRDRRAAAGARRFELEKTSEARNGGGRRNAEKDKQNETMNEMLDLMSEMRISQEEREKERQQKDKEREEREKKRDEEELKHKLTWKSSNEET